MKAKTSYISYSRSKTIIVYIKGFPRMEIDEASQRCRSLYPGKPLSYGFWNNTDTGIGKMGMARLKDIGFEI